MHILIKQTHFLCVWKFVHTNLSWTVVKIWNVNTKKPAEKKNMSKRNIVKSNIQRSMYFALIARDIWFYEWIKWNFAISTSLFTVSLNWTKDRKIMENYGKIIFFQDDQNGRSTTQMK